MLALALSLGACTVPGKQPLLPAPLNVRSDAAAGSLPSTPDGAVVEQTRITPMPAPPSAPLGATASARDSAAVASAAGASKEPTSINLDQVTLGTFAQLIYADLLKRNVNVDAQVMARKDLVTFRSGPAQAPDKLENAAKLLLKSYGVTVVDTGGLVRVVPDNANLGALPEIRRGAALPDTPLPLRPVFQLVELQAVRQTDVNGWLRTMFGDRIKVQEDVSRNALLLSGTPDNMQAALEAIRVLDQPVLSGSRSVSIAPMYWSADDLARRLIEVLSAEGYAVQPLGQQAGGVRYPIVILPVSGLNSVFVFASAGTVIDHVTEWARRLDKPNERGVGKNFFTYAVRHKDAAVLAKTLEQLIGRAVVTAVATGAAAAASQPRAGSVVVDASTNTLIFLTSQDEYSQITSLLQTLDRPAKGALIEVTVAELLIDDNSQLGVEWLATKATANGGTAVGGYSGGPLDRHRRFQYQDLRQRRCAAHGDQCAGLGQQGDGAVEPPGAGTQRRDGDHPGRPGSAHRHQPADHGYLHGCRKQPQDPADHPVPQYRGDPQGQASDPFQRSDRPRRFAGGQRRAVHFDGCERVADVHDAQDRYQAHLAQRRHHIVGGVDFRRVFPRLRGHPVPQGHSCPGGAVQYPNRQWQAKGVGDADHALRDQRRPRRGVGHLSVPKHAWPVGGHGACGQRRDRAGRSAGRAARRPIVDRSVAAMTKQAVAPRIGELLLARQLIKPAELERGLAFQAEHGGRLGVVLVRMGALSEDALYAALAEQLGQPLTDGSALTEAQVGDGLAAWAGFSRAWWARRQALPWRDADGVLHVAAADAYDADLRETLAAAGGSAPVWHFMLPAALERWHDALKQGDHALAGALDARALRELAEDAPVIAFVNNVLAQAVEARASDIHLEPGEREFSVRFRIDGVLHTRLTQPIARYAAIASRVKLVSQLDIAERRLPQDGRTSIRVAGAEMDVRVSAIPAVHGESLVLRLLPKERADLRLDRLGMAPDHLAMFESWLAWPNGMVLVTGPTGSGKSTTLYGALAAINDLSRKIITVEDPVEFRLPNVVQIQTQAEIGYTFARALRSILRHDPDIIMVGRDPRPRDGRDRSAVRAHRAPGAGHAAHQRCAVGRHPAGGHGDRTLPGGRGAESQHGATSGTPPVQLPALSRMSRQRPCCSAGRRSRRGCPPGRCATARRDGGAP